MNPFTTANFIDPLTVGFENVVPKIPAAIFAFLFGFVVIRLISWTAQALLRLVHMPKGLRGIVVSIMDALLWIFLIIAVLQALGLNNLALVFSGAIAAIGLALGAGGATLASDILAGVFLAQDRDFNIGDEIRGGEGPTVGVIENMDMRRTRIRDNEGKLHVIPNTLIERKEWVVLTQKKDLK